MSFAHRFDNFLFLFDSFKWRLLSQMHIEEGGPLHFHIEKSSPKLLEKNHIMPKMTSSVIYAGDKMSGKTPITSGIFLLGPEVHECGMQVLINVVETEENVFFGQI